MRWHLIEGEPGCRFAREHDAIAVVVDALRASATAAMMLDAGATEIRATNSLETALRLKEEAPDCLLFGERGGVPPEGFDYGNSPLDAVHAAGRPVCFTTTTGTTRLLECRGAAEIYMASCVNAIGLLNQLGETDRDVVLIPAGRAGDPDFDADEDWAAAAFIAQLADAEVAEGAAWYREWRQRLEWDGLEHWFMQSPHGQKLIALGFEQDVQFCARPNVTTAVPRVYGSGSKNTLTIQRS